MMITQPFNSSNQVTTTAVRRHDTDNDVLCVCRYDADDITDVFQVPPLQIAGWKSDGTQPDVESVLR